MGSVQQFERVASKPDAQRVAEVSLTLRNLSYMLTHVTTDAHALTPENLTATLFGLHRQIDDLSTRLEDLCDAGDFGPDGNLTALSVVPASKPESAFAAENIVTELKVAG